MNIEALIMTAVSLAACVVTYWWGRNTGRNEYNIEHLVSVYKEGYEAACDDVCEELERYKNMLIMEEEMRDE